MPSNIYSACFDFARLGAGTVSGSNAAVFSGGLTGNLGFTAGMYAHGSVAGPSATIDGAALSAWKAACEAMISGLTVTFIPASATYEITAASIFAVAWTGAQGALMADILGFDSAANLSGSKTYSSVRRPKYLIVSAVAGQSQVHETYEPSGRVSYAESDNGSAYAITPDALPLYRDWTQPFESNIGPTDAAWNASTIVGGAPMTPLNVGSATLVTWTWYAFFAHLRSTLPFVLVDSTTSVSGEGVFYKLRGDGAHFDPTRVTADYDGHWSVPFRARYLGPGTAA